MLYINMNAVAIETSDKIKKVNKSVFKTLTIKSLKRDEVIKFISENVINIDDKIGDGIVTYYFKDKKYQRYKDLKLISEDNWNLSKFGTLQIFYNKKKNKWKIQTEKENVIKIKDKKNSIGVLHEFSYQNKTNYYLKLEEIKINLKRE